jgi:hypothetical protein
MRSVSLRAGLRQRGSHALLFCPASELAGYDRAGLSALRGEAPCGASFLLFPLIEQLPPLHHNTSDAKNGHPLDRSD